MQNIDIASVLPLLFGAFVLLILFLIIVKRIFVNVGAREIAIDDGLAAIPGTGVLHLQTDFFGGTAVLAALAQTPGQIDPKAAMARGTGSDPINETRAGERERRPRTRREREGGSDGRRPRTENQ